MMIKRLISLIQAGHYMVVGLWPVVHPQSYESMTGRKHDEWLEKKSGLLLALVGAYFLLAGVSKPSGRTRAFGVIFPAGLATADVMWGWRKTRKQAYLINAAVAGVAILAWLLAGGGGKKIKKAGEVGREVAKKLPMRTPFD